MEQTETVRKELGALQYNIFPGLFIEASQLKNDGKVPKEDLEILY
jgi:hypothetical protein